MIDDLGAVHEAWLADYKSYQTDAFCSNPACARYGEPVTVLYEQEYGQGWISPEECGECRQSLSLDAPPERDEED